MQEELTQFWEKYQISDVGGSRKKLINLFKKKTITK
jgi:hypothetical protein